VVRGLDRPWIEARYHLIGTAIHLALSLVLVPRFGIEGAVAALLVSGVIAVAYFMWAFHRFVGEPFLPWLREVALAPAAISACAAAGSLLLRGGPWLSPPAGRAAAWGEVAACAAIFLVVVGGGYLALRVIPLDELRALFGGRFEEERVSNV
jgi:O-antigen/teichoic acid export membrane protein